MNPFGCDKACPDRKPGCHGTCETYQEGKRRYQEEQAKIRGERKKMNDLIEVKQKLYKTLWQIQKKVINFG